MREILRCSKNERCCSRELDTKIDTTEMLSGSNQPELRNCVKAHRISTHSARVCKVFLVVIDSEATYLVFEKNTSIYYTFTRNPSNT